MRKYMRATSKNKTNYVLMHWTVKLRNNGFFNERSFIKDVTQKRGRDSNVAIKL